MKERAKLIRIRAGCWRDFCYSIFNPLFALMKEPLHGMTDTERREQKPQSSYENNRLKRELSLLITVCAMSVYNVGKKCG